MTKETDKIQIPEVASMFPQLTLSQLRLLGYCAFRGSYPANSWTITLYEGAFDLPKGKTARDRSVLEEKGYLKGGEVPPGNYFDAAVCVHRHFPEWIPQYEKAGRVRPDKFIFLWKLAGHIAAGDLSSVSDLSYPRNCETWRYLSGIILSEGNSEILSLLPSSDAGQLLRSVLLSALLSGTMEEKTASQVKEMTRVWLPEPSPIEDMADTFLYYMTGKESAPRNGRPTAWSLALSGVKDLLRGEITSSMESFIRSSDHSAVGTELYFPDPVTAWMHALCLVRNIRKFHSSRPIRALEEMKGSHLLRYNTLLSPLQTLLQNMDSGEKDCIERVRQSLSTSQQKGFPPLSKDLALMVLKYFRFDDVTIRSMGLDPERRSEIGIIANEMASIFPTSSVTKENLKALFGGTGIIGSVPRKESWEMALSEITSSADSSKAEEVPEEKRIIYFVDDKWITALLEQTKNPSTGVWGGDRLLSRSEFLRGEYEAMDITDLRLSRALSTKPIQKPDITVIVPMMAGSGRVFTGQHFRQPYTPLEIENEAPFVAFTGKGGSISVSSNISPGKDGVIPPVTVRRNGLGYKCISANPVQRDIIAHLLEVGTFPSSALPSIRSTISSLEGVLEVKSDLSRTAFIPTMEGSTRVCIRIVPMKDDDGYSLKVAAAPYEDGDLRCPPGDGERDVYDSTGGESRFIRRDLQSEYDNYCTLREFFDSLDLECEDDGTWNIYDSSSLLEVLSFAYDNRDICFTEWPEGRALRFRGELKRGDIDITVSSGMNWFEVEGNVNLGGNSIDLEELLRKMKETPEKGFIKLGEKDYIRMTKTIEQHLRNLDALLAGGEGRGRKVPVYRVGPLAEVLGSEGGLDGEMDEGFKNFLRKMQEAYDTVPEVPKGLNATLRPYQKEGYVWMKRLDSWGAGACLADDMGLGKTVQTLAFILSKSSEGPSLVIAPKSVLPNWESEAAKFVPSLKVTVLNETRDRRDAVAKAGPDEIILSTYGVLSTESDTLASREWNVVCLDEAHQIKNRNTRVSAAAMELKASSRVILTGTPIQNHLGELWNLFQFLNPGLLGSWQDFKARYMVADRDERNSGFLRDLIQPFILRRTKEEVLDELPEKIIYEQTVRLSPEEMQVYEAMRTDVESRIKDPSGGKKGRSVPFRKDSVPVDFFAELTRLRLASLSLSLVSDDWKGGSSKTEALLDLLEQIYRVEGNQVLVFSQFTSYLTQIKVELDKRGYRYLYLDGQTELEERRDLVRQFQEGDCPLFLSSLKAGGLGLNLTAANYVIILDPWWNPAIENQAMDRAHRIGQKRTVTVIRLISEHTIEEKILRLHESKQALSDEMLDGTAYSGKLTMDDVLDMVSPFR